MMTGVAGVSLHFQYLLWEGKRHALFTWSCEAKAFSDRKETKKPWTHWLREGEAPAKPRAYTGNPAQQELCLPISRRR